MRCLFEIRVELPEAERGTDVKLNPKETKQFAKGDSVNFQALGLFKLNAAKPVDPNTGEPPAASG